MQLEYYLLSFGKFHTHPANIFLHHICIPLIGWSTLAFAHTWIIGAGLRFSYILALITILGYLKFKNIRLIAVIIGCLTTGFLTFKLVTSLREVALVVFLIAWFGQFSGHWIEGKKPAFQEELVFIFIGPVWVFKRLL